MVSMIAGFAVAIAAAFAHPFLDPRLLDVRWFPVVVVVVIVVVSSTIL